MDKGAWWSTVHGVARVRYDLGTKPPSPLKHHLHCYFLEWRLFHFVSTKLCALKGWTGIVFLFTSTLKGSSFQLTYILLTLLRPICVIVSPLSQLDSMGPSR